MDDIIECIAAAMRLELDNKIVVGRDNICVEAANGTTIQIKIN